jgi:hypothetical protein
MDHRSDICHQSIEISAAERIELSITNGKRAPVPSFLFDFTLALRVSNTRSSLFAGFRYFFSLSIPSHPITLHCIILYYIILYYIALYYIILYYITLYYIPLHSTPLRLLALIKVFVNPLSRLNWNNFDCYGPRLIHTWSVIIHIRKRR